MKKKFISVVLALAMTLMFASPVLAQTWLVYYPTIVIDDTGGDRPAVPVITGMEGQDFIDAGVLSASGMDSRMRVAGTDIPYMLSTTQIPVYLESLPALGQVQTDLYVGYSTDNPDLLDIITGTDGYITITDDTPIGDQLELGSDFEIELSGYVDTTGGADVNLVYKEDAFRTYIDGANAITSEIEDTVAFASSTSDGDLKENNAVYNTAWIDPIADFVNSANTTVMGQRLGFDIWRCFFYFDTSAVPGEAIITSATLRLYGSADSSVTDFDMTIQIGAGGRPSDPLVVGDYDKTFYSDDGGSLTTVGFNVAGYNDIALNATGISWINKAGITELCLRSSEDIAGSQPVGDEWVTVYTNDEAGTDKDPQLVIEYYIEITATPVSSGEYTVKTYGVADEPDWATGDVLHFTGAATSNIDVGQIHNSITTLWVSGWFNLDSDFDDTEVANQFIIGKRVDANNRWDVYLDAGDGAMYFNTKLLGVNFYIGSVETSWVANTWYHFIVSISVANNMRLIINGGVPVTDANNQATPAASDFIIGNLTDGGVEGFVGEIQSVIVGTGDLSTDEEDDLYAGIAPTGGNAPTNYWYADEGTGTGVDAVIDYGSAPSHGDVDAACTWETATFTTGQTGRWCDFYIEVDDVGAGDADRWGTNLKGASVLDNANDWILNQNNVLPWMDYYYHTVGGVLHAWYQPNYMVEGTAYDGTADAGSDDDEIVDAELVQADDYWIGALVTITDTGVGHAAPEGEARVCTAFADVGNKITVDPAFSANVELDDTYTVDFATLIDRSHYGLEFDGANQYVDIGNVGSIKTICYWIKPNEVDTEVIDLDGGTHYIRYNCLPFGFANYIVYIDGSLQSLGSELMPNATFDANVDGWQDVGGSTEWNAADGGVMKKITDGGVNYAADSCTVEVDSYYLITCQVTNLGTSTNSYEILGTAKVAGAGYNDYLYRSGLAATTYYDVIKAISPTFWFNMGINGALNNWAYFDNLSVKKIVNPCVEDDWQFVVITTDTAINANAVRIARRGADYGDFQIDGVGFYDRVLSADEIDYNYNSGAGIYASYSSSGLVGEWHIEEGSGAATADTSGEGNNGTLVNTPDWVNGYVPRPAGNAGTNDARLTWGVNDNITLVYGEPVNYTTTASGLSGEPGYSVAEADMPDEWYSTATELANLPLYPMMDNIHIQTGIPTQTLYVFIITGLCFAFAVAAFVMFKSVVASIVGIGLGLGIGAAMTIVPMWILFAFLVMAIGIAYLKGRVVFG